MTELAAAPAQAPGLSRGWLLALLPAGFVFGVIGAFFQEHRLTVGTIAVPVAALIVVAALLATVRALSWEMGTKLAGSFYYGGWLIATALMALPNPSGDIVFTADIGAYGYLLAGTVLGGAAAAWPLIGQAPPAGAPLAEEPAAGL